MEKIYISPSPHIHSRENTAGLMRDVVIALLPAVLVSVLFYGPAELLVLGVSIASCLLCEWLVARFLMNRRNTLRDGSALVTGILLALNLPVSCPWWIVLIGAVFAIAVVKMTFGGLGQNIFNPAIAGRVFLLVSFPAQMTAWQVPTPGAAPLDLIRSAWGLQALDATTGATPLGLVKEGLKLGESLPRIFGDNGLSSLKLLTLNMSGSAGEISCVALLLGFVYLLLRRVIRPHTTLSIWGAVALFSLVFWLIDPSRYTGPVFNLLTGGMLLGSIFMATDYVTSPMSDRGCILYGAGIGLLAMVIRYWGAYPEGISFAILIMNMTVPLINRVCHPKKFGR